MDDVIISDSFVATQIRCAKESVERGLISYDEIIVNATAWIWQLENATVRNVQTQDQEWDRLRQLKTQKAILEGLVELNNR